jgi:integrase
MDRHKIEAALAVLGAELRGLDVTRDSTCQTVGQVYMRFRRSRPHDRAWTLVRGLLRPFVVRYWREPCEAIGVSAWDAHRKLRTAEVTRLGRPPCGATLNLELARAKQLFKWAVSRELIRVNPLEGAKREAAISARETWLTAGQVDQLLCAAREDPFLTAWILIAVGTGMRMGEIMSLRWDRISPLGVVILNARSTKTRTRHVVALPASALAALEALPRSIGCPYVFTNPSRDRRYNPCTIRRWFRRAAEDAGLDAVVAEGDVKLLCHDCRHTFASIADSRGASPTAIRDALNHASLATTARYMHRARADGALAMALLMDRRPAQKSERVGARKLDVSISTGVQRSS